MWSGTSKAGGRGGVGTETERPGVAEAAPISSETHAPRGRGSRRTRHLPASSSSEAKPGRGGRAGERKWQPRGGKRGGRCGSAPDWGSLTAGRGGTQRPWHLGGGCGVATRTERSRGDKEGGEGGSAAQRAGAQARQEALKKKEGGRRGGTQQGRRDPLSAGCSSPRSAQPWPHLLHLSPQTLVSHWRIGSSPRLPPPRGPAPPLRLAPLHMM